MSTLNIKVGRKQALKLRLSKETGRINNPGLQSVWDVSTNPQKDTFVDANTPEILTFIDDELLQLSAEATAAIDNIQSNGGTLTSFEKWYVSIWVDRMVANGDWALLDFLVYAGFSDDLCKLTDWKSGTLMVNGGTFDGQNWVFDGTADSRMDTNFNPFTDGVNFQQNDACIGVYINKKTTIDGGSDFGADQTTVRLLHNTQVSNKRAILRVNDNTNFIGDSNPQSKMLVSLVRKDANNAAYYQNGVEVDTQVSTSTGLTNLNVFLGGGNLNGVHTFRSNPEIAMFFAGAFTSFDQADFYAGFEDFRTSLHPEILYNMPQPTGQTTSYRTGDDADIESSLFKHFRRAQGFWNGEQPQLVDFTTLVRNNTFGNTDRFTSENGDQVYTNSLMIDHYTGLMWIDNFQVAADWNTAIDNAIASTFGGYSDWFIPNNEQLFSVSESYALGKFLSSLGIGGSTQVWSSTTYNSNTSYALQYYFYQNQRFFQIAKTGTNKQYLLCRKHY